MTISQDTTNLHFDDVFVIYYNDGGDTVSCTDYLYFSEEDAQKTADDMNENYAFGKDERFKHRVSTLTEYIYRYGDDMRDKGENGARATMSFND